jgi:hypothetical protein
MPRRVASTDYWLAVEERVGLRCSLDEARQRLLAKGLRGDEPRFDEEGRRLKGDPNQCSSSTSISTRSPIWGYWPSLRQELLTTD